MAMRWSLHADIVMGRTYFHCGFESRPCAWNAGINNKKGTLAADAQNALDTGTIHPSGSTRVPGPSSAPDMWRDGVDIGCDDVRPDLVAFDGLARARLADTLEERCVGKDRVRTCRFWGWG